MIKLHKHFVTNGEDKARVFYYLNKDADGMPYITIYDKDYGNNIEKIFPRSEGYKNGTEIGTDYHEHGHVKLCKDHAMYPTALKFCEPKFLKELDSEISKRSRYGDAVNVILESMASDLVNIFGWGMEDALKRCGLHIDATIEIGYEATKSDVIEIDLTTNSLESALLDAFGKFPDLFVNPSDYSKISFLLREKDMK